VEGDLFFRIQRTDCPNNSLLSAVVENSLVQFVDTLQRPLVGDNRVAVDQSGVKQADVISAFLQFDPFSLQKLFYYVTYPNPGVWTASSGSSALRLAFQEVVDCVALEVLGIHPSHNCVSSNHLGLFVVAGHSEGHVLTRVCWEKGALVLEMIGELFLTSYRFCPRAG